MEAAGVKNKTNLLNEAGEADTAVEETVGGSGDDGGARGETILREIGDDTPTEDVEEDAEDEEEDENLYEVEAIRRKRVYNGEVQYLIKWYDWPETSNTWEPLENLQSISASIKAFEERLRKAGKKRQGKYGGGSTSQSKKKKQRLTNGTSEVSLNGEEKEHDPTLNELRGPVVNSNGAGSSQEGGEGIGSEDDDVTISDLLKVKRKKADKKRVRGAKRRKSGIVKRFIPEATTSNNQTIGTDQNVTPDLDIVRIIMPVGVSTSTTNDRQDSVVTFSVLRSDGEEVTVDNKFLRAHNHHLLLDFYEEHIKYKPES